jgi:hypothetical protein
MEIKFTNAENGWMAQVDNKVYVGQTFYALALKIDKMLKKSSPNKEVTGVKVDIKKVSNSQ